ncbi:hypothetical protein [Pseudomethylobacillus aquaticus]|nr:hypothetical protein [Pseudomethylobacillus aquaticus]
MSKRFFSDFWRVLLWLCVIVLALAYTHAFLNLAGVTTWPF